MAHLLAPLLIVAGATVALCTGHLSETAFVALLGGAGVAAPAAAKLGEVKGTGKP